MPPPPPPPPPPPRRVPDHETVLPSVEHETVDLVSPPRTINERHPVSDRNDMQREYNDMQSKRTAHPSFSQPINRHQEDLAQRRKQSLNEQHARPGYEPNKTAAYSHAREHIPMGTRSRHKAHPSQETIDLTSSPRRPPFGNASTLSTASRGYPAAGSSNYAYAPEVPHRSSVRIDYHGHPVEARSNTYVSEQDRMYQRRAPPAHEYVPLER